MNPFPNLFGQDVNPYMQNASINPEEVYQVMQNQKRMIDR